MAITGTKRQAGSRRDSLHEIRQENQHQFRQIPDFLSGQAQAQPHMQVPAQSSVQGSQHTQHPQATISPFPPRTQDPHFFHQPNPFHQKEFLPESSFLQEELHRQHVPPQSQSQSQPQQFPIFTTPMGVREGEQRPQLTEDIEFKKSPRKIVIVMSKISLISIIFGLVLLSILFFVAGLFTSVYLGMGSHISGSTASISSLLPSLPKMQLPTKQQVTESVGAVVTNTLGTAPSKDVVDKKVQDTIKKALPAAAAPIVNKVLSAEEFEGEFIENSKRVPAETDAGRFSVQAKVYADGSMAMQLAKKLKEAGYGSYIVRQKDVENPRIYYHVRAGSFGDYMAANTLVRKLRDMGNRSATVVLISRGEDRLQP